MGDLSTDRTVDLAISELTALEGNAIAAGDSFLFWDVNAAEHRRVTVQNAGLRVKYTQGTQTLANDDMNCIMEFSAGGTVTIPANSTTALPLGAGVILVNAHASSVVTIDAASGVTLNSIWHAGGVVSASDELKAGGTAALLKINTDEWYLSGDIQT